MSRTLAGKYRPKLGAGHVFAFSLAGTLITGAFLGSMLVPNSPTDQGEVKTVDWTRSVPCATEDSVSCYWDATKHGNGQGRSFVTDAEGNVTYLPAPVPMPGSVGGPSGAAARFRPVPDDCPGCEIGTAVSIDKTPRKLPKAGK